MTGGIAEFAAPGHVLIVGASAAGLSTAEALRRKGFTGRLTMLGDETHVPYDRPPLSKQVLSGAWEPERVALRMPDVLDKLDAELILGDEAISLDAHDRSVRTAAGRLLRADAIVIATGGRARRLPEQDALAGVYSIRTLDDSLALRQALATSARLVVVGEGVLGAETAATAAGLGIDVTIAGPLAAPMALQLGSFVSERLADLHRSNGVTLRLGTAVSGLMGQDGRVTGVKLSSGEILPADVVVVSIGAIPATEWLADSGLELDNGVVCDASCRAGDGIYAVGDVARWHHEHAGRHVRLENRTNATEQAAAVADTILGGLAPYAPVPYFWSDQFGIKIQVYGSIPADSEPDIVEGDAGADRFVARYRSAGATVGVIGWNMPKQARQRRQEIVDALQSAPVV